MQNINSFTISAAFGDANIETVFPSDMVAEVVANFSSRFSMIGADEIRSNVRQLVVTSLMNETHHDEEEAEAVSCALVWLTATGPNADSLLPMMESGGVRLHYEISRLGPTTFNFRLSYDPPDASK